MPTATVTESTRCGEDVINADDVVLSSTQLSKSIDMLGDDSQRRARRPMSTSVATFPCCRQVRFKAHEISPFPLIFENNLRVVDHVENISMHDLLKDIKMLINNERNINHKMLPLMGKECSRDPRLFGVRDQWRTNRMTDIVQNFPVKFKQSKSYDRMHFPCNSFDFKCTFTMENPLPCGTQSFPLKFKCEIVKFPYCLEKAENSLYDCNKYLKKLQDLKATDCNKVPEIFENKRVVVGYNSNRKDSLVSNFKNQRGYGSTLTQLECHRFPLKTHKKWGIDNKFPFLTLRQVDFIKDNINRNEMIGFGKIINIKRTADMRNLITSSVIQDSVQPQNTYLDQECLSSLMNQSSQCSYPFPIKVKAINNKFPVQHKLQFPNPDIRSLQTKLISKSLQDLLPKSYINAPNMIKLEFPLEYRRNQKRLKQFPVKFYERLLQPYRNLNQTIIKTFPVTYSGKKSKFPLKNISEKLNLNLSVNEMKQKLKITKVNKTLQWKQKCLTAKYYKSQENLESNKKFPFTCHLSSFHQKENPKFPLSQQSPLDQQFYKPLTKSRKMLNRFDGDSRFPEGIKAFPLKKSLNFEKFPFDYYPRDLMQNLSVPEVKQKFHSNKISKSLQILQNLYENVNIKTFTKFPLKERMVKKFYWKFPSEKDIPMAHGKLALWKDKISIGQQENLMDFSNNQNNSRNNVSIFKIITTAEAVPSMTPDLYKQQCWSFCQHRNTTDVDNDDDDDDDDNDNEKHASQVQFTQQVHVENPVRTQSLIPRPRQKTQKETHNKDDNVNVNDSNILPATDAKNISLTTTTTKTATEVGQYSENFEHHDAIIHTRGDNDEDVDDDGGNVSLSSVKTLSQNIRNSSFNHRHERERCDVDGILRASTPPTSAITSVQNTERLLVLHDHVSRCGDLCNPQVAQIVECSSEVRDTSNTAVDNGEHSTKLNFSITGSILDKNQNESSTPPPKIPAPSLLTSPYLTLLQTPSPPPTPSTPSPPTPPPLPSHFLNSNVAADASISDRICSTSFKENYLNSSEILPKYSVLELCEGNVINCPDIDSITKITHESVQILRQSSEKECAAAVSRDKTDDQVQQDTKNINENFQNSTNDEHLSLDNLEIDDLDFVSDVTLEITDDMKFEMKSSKGTLPVTASASARNIGKSGETGTVTPLNRSKPYGNTVSVRGSLDHVPLSTVNRSTALQKPTKEHSFSGIPPMPAALRGSSDRVSSTASTTSLPRPTATRRLSSDYSSGPASATYSTTPHLISNIPPSLASQRTSSNLTSFGSPLTLNYGNDTAKNATATSLTNRYTNDTTPTLGTPAATPKLKYTRRPTSGALLSLDLPHYTASVDSLTDASAAINRGVSLDTPTISDVLPERTRLRRQRRFRSQDSQDQDEDPIERLNRLKARISASLSEVKGVLKQYSTEGDGENDTQTSTTMTPSTVTSSILGKLKEDAAAEEKDKTVSSSKLGNLKEDAAAEEKEEEGPVTFRFVKKIRRRSFFTEDDADDDAKQKTGNDEVDKSQSITFLHKDTSQSLLKLPQATVEIPKELKNQELQAKTQAHTNTPIINLENSDIQGQDIGPTSRISQKSEENQDQTFEKWLNPKLQLENSKPELNKQPRANGENLVDEGNRVHIIDNKLKAKNNDIKNNETKLVDIESNVLPKPEIRDDNKVCEKISEKPTAKKVQSTKVKSNKNGSQQRETKTGKSSSKIPQRVETKPINKQEDTSASDRKTAKNDYLNETRQTENNAKEIKKPEQSQKDIVPKHQESGNDKGVKEVSPKPNVTDINIKPNKGKDIIIKEISPQTVNQQESAKQQLKDVSPKPIVSVTTFKHKDINTKEISPPPKLIVTDKYMKINKDEVDKVKKESSPKPTKLKIEVNEGKPITTEAVQRIRDLSPKPKLTVDIITDNKNTTIISNTMENHTVKTPQPNSSLKLLNKTEPTVMDKTQTLTSSDSDLSDKELITKTPVKLRKKISTKSKDLVRRASLAAVEGSKIEPPVKIATPSKIQRRPSDSEAIIKKKLITTKTTTSGSIEEVTPKPKIVKVKRSSIKKPISPPTTTTTNNNDTRHQLATTQAEANKEALSIEANKTIQGDRNKDVTMPNDETPTQMPPPPSLQPLANNSKSPVGQINQTQLLINEAATNHSPSTSSPSSSSSLTRKTIQLDASSSQATIENATAKTTNLAASKFENSEGVAMLANSKPTLVSSTTASSASNGPKQTIQIPTQEDLHDLLLQEAVIIIKPAKKDPNELLADEINKEEGKHKISPTPANLETSAKQLNEPLEIPQQQQQQQVVNRTDIKPNDGDSVQAIATPPQQSTTSEESVNLASTKSSSSDTIKQQTKQQQQQQHTPTTTTSATIEEDATTKTNDSPQISISSQEATTEDTHLKAATQTPTTSIPEATTPLQIQQSKGLKEDLGKMPELQLTPAPVQTAEIPHEAHKKKSLHQHTVTTNAKVAPTEAPVIPEIILDQAKDDNETTISTPLSAGEDLSETTELSTEESSSQSEAGAAAAKPKKVRKVKKKVIIKRQKRRLSISGDSFFNHDATEQPENLEVETLEKPIAFVSDEDSVEEEPDTPVVVEEKKPLKSCINKKEYEIGDEILYGERIKRTQIKWRRGRVKERTSPLFYLLDIDGNEISTHVNYLKRFTGRKVNFGAKEYLEIDYEQLAEDEDRAERVKQRTFSIWNMV